MYACVWMVQMNERKTAVQNKPQVRTIQTTRIFHTHTESKQNSEMKTYPFCVREGWWWEWAGPVCQAVWGRVYWERHRGSMPRPLGLGDPEHVFVGLIRCSLGVCDLVLWRAETHTQTHTCGLMKTRKCLGGANPLLTWVLRLGSVKSRHINRQTDTHTHTTHTHTHTHAHTHTYGLMKTRQCLCTSTSLDFSSPGQCTGKIKTIKCNINKHQHLWTFPHLDNAQVTST